MDTLQLQDSARQRSDKISKPLEGLADGTTRFLAANSGPMALVVVEHHKPIRRRMQPVDVPRQPTDSARMEHVPNCRTPDGKWNKALIAGVVCG